MRFLRVTLIWLPIWFPLLMLPFVFNEEVDCHIDNIKRGYFWSADFSSDVVVTGDDRARRIDFTRLRQFTNICVVQMYAPGEPYGFRTTTGDFKYGGPRSCWRDGDGKLTVAGIDNLGDPTWTQLTFKASRHWYISNGESCVEPDAALLDCVADRCSFPSRK